MLLIILVQISLLNIFNLPEIDKNLTDTLMIIQNGVSNSVVTCSDTLNVNDSIQGYNGSIEQKGTNNQVELKEKSTGSESSNIKKTNIQIQQTGNNNHVRIK